MVSKKKTHQTKPPFTNSIFRLKSGLMVSVNKDENIEIDKLAASTDIEFDNDDIRKRLKLKTS